MLITDKNKLRKYFSEHRLWQGIPSIEVTGKGRVFITFYSGGTKEEIGNYSMVLKSDDGVNFGEPIAVAYLENHRCYDPCLWIDPLGRLWFTWALALDHGVYGVICNDPDADELVWSEPFEIGGEVMMNKPTVLTTGEWLFPSAIWADNVTVLGKENKSSLSDRKSFIYKTVDNGKTFEQIGGAEVPDRSFDEHMVLELKDGTLAMYVRTFYGIGVSYSYDRGRTWTPGVDSRIKGPSSRFHIRRLKSGRILLINHINFTGRNNLAAMLSEDDGKTWKYTLMLDERNDVSYPDAKEDEDGYIHITYDRQRGGFLSSMDKVYESAREILYAKITEEDIMAGKLVSPDSKLKCIASKLGEYAEEYENPFCEIDKYTDAELAKVLDGKTANEVLNILFNQYPVNCMNMHKIDSEKLDGYIEELKNSTGSRTALKKIISLIRSASGEYNEKVPVVERVKEIVSENLENDVQISDIAEKIGISVYYITHLFKKVTGLTITDYRNGVKLAKAKDMLVNSNKKIVDIAFECGFGSASYFSKMFMASEKVSPSRYRNLLRNTDKSDKDAILYNMLPGIEFLSDPDLIPEKDDEVKTYVVSMPDEEFSFLHESAIIEYKGKLFAAWYNNVKDELRGRTPVRFSRSEDGGKTWTSPEIVADDESGKILFCPPVFGVDGGSLYMFLNRMVAPDHIHSLDLYKYNEENNTFELLWSRPVPFKLNTNVYRLNNGKLMLMGRMGELDKFPNTPAVLISDSGRIDSEWRMVKMQEDGNLSDGSKYIHPEASAVVDGDTVYAFVRNDERNVPLVYVSKNNCESWSGPYAHDIPLSPCKIYSGTLSDGRNYVIGNLKCGREQLAVYFSEPGTMKFNKAIMLQDKYSEELGFGWDWHYPCACESNGKLYVIYTVNVGPDSFVKRGAVVSEINIHLDK